MVAGFAAVDAVVTAGAEAVGAGRSVPLAGVVEIACGATTSGAIAPEGGTSAVMLAGVVAGGAMTGAVALGGVGVAAHAEARAIVAARQPRDESRIMGAERFHHCCRVTQGHAVGASGQVPRGRGNVRSGAARFDAVARLVRAFGVGDWVAE